MNRASSNVTARNRLVVGVCVLLVGFLARPRRRVLAGGASLAMIVALASPGLAYQRPGRTARVSVSSTGAQGNQGSYLPPSISADGRYVAFHSRASNLVPGDTNAGGGALGSDIFVHDRTTGITERVSVSSSGAQANEDSVYPSISADGRYVAFQSKASNFGGDSNGVADIFVRDRLAGLTTRVSVSSNGAAGNAVSWWPSISADGRHVAFPSFASNLVPGDTNAVWDVFAHDIDTGITERVSVTSDGAQASGGDINIAPWCTISANGRYVAFVSPMTNLVFGDTNQSRDAFLHDRVTGTTERVSVASDGSQADPGAFSTPAAVFVGNFQPVVSADGRYVAFDSFAPNLAPGDTNASWDVFVRDRQMGTTERVSINSDGSERSTHSASPSMTPDGRYVSFYTVPGYGSGALGLPPERNVYIHDRETGVTERVSVATDGGSGNYFSWQTSMSADGRYVAFDSEAWNLVPNDTNGSDIFVRDRGPEVGVGDVTSVVQGEQASVSGSATFTGQTVSEAIDPVDDAIAGVAGAGPSGAELTRASLIYRPEQGDLLVELDLAALPGKLSVGTPGILYGLRFDVGGTQYQVRALRSVAAYANDTSSFTLHRCDPVCGEQARLTGGIGTAGTKVRVSVPLAALDVEEGAALSAILAFTSVGEAGPGAVAAIDTADLAAATIPARSVSLGVAATGAAEDDVTFDAPATLAGGSFAGSVDVSSFAPDTYRIWARACLGERCGSLSMIP